MDTATYKAIVSGTPGVIVQVAAADLRQAVAEMVQCERTRTAEAIASHRERPTMTREDAAKALNVTLSTLWRWAKMGYLNPVKIGTKVLYRASDIDRMLETKNNTGK